MPIYEYQCDCGEKAAKLLSMQERNQQQVCKCGKVMLRMMSVPMPAIITPTGKGMALDTLNERRPGRGMPNRRWKPEAERLAAAGLD